MWAEGSMQPECYEPRSGMHRSFAAENAVQDDNDNGLHNDNGVQE